jgi:3-polyprenyl-4-hydroxybenzoate decarboxylase
MKRIAGKTPEEFARELFQAWVMGSLSGSEKRGTLRRLRRKTDIFLYRDTVSAIAVHAACCEMRQEKTPPPALSSVIGTLASVVGATCWKAQRVSQAVARREHWLGVHFALCLHIGGALKGQPSWSLSDTIKYICRNGQ